MTVVLRIDGNKCHFYFLSGLFLFLFLLEDTRGVS